MMDAGVINYHPTQGDPKVKPDWVGHGSMFHDFIWSTVSKNKTYTGWGPKGKSYGSKFHTIYKKIFSIF